MQAKKQALENGIDSLSSLPINSCCVVYTTSNQDDRDDYVLHLEYSEFGSDHWFFVPLEFDRVLGKWLKIKKIIDLPGNCRICAILFIQSFWINRFLTPSLHKGYVSQSLLDDENLFANDFRGIEHMNPGLLKLETIKGPLGQKLIHYRSITIDPTFPFLVVELLDDHVTHLTERDFNISILTKLDRPIHFIPTSSPKYYLLIFSDILNSEKDVAKLMRKYLHQPDHAVFQDRFACIPQLKIELGISDPNLCVSFMFFKILKVEDYYDMITYNDDDDKTIYDSKTESIQNIGDNFVLQVYLNANTPEEAYRSMIAGTKAIEGFYEYIGQFTGEPLKILS